MKARSTQSRERVKGRSPLRSPEAEPLGSPISINVRREKTMMKLPLNVDFTGKVVVVTGAGGVLCGEMARAYAQAGAKVAALDLNEEAVKKLAK